jgi:hypothetical protein
MSRKIDHHIFPCEMSLSIHLSRRRRAILLNKQCFTEKSRPRHSKLMKLRRRFRGNFVEEKCSTLMVRLKRCVFIRSVEEKQCGYRIGRMKYRSLSSVDLISYLSVWVEFWTRFILLNIPSALLVNFPELDRVSSIGFTYLALQVVGYCWAFLVNAAFAISCQAASFLPFNQTNEEATTLQLISSFYFAYASARVVISYAHHASYLGYQSLQDFPHIISVRICLLSLKLTFLVAPQTSLRHSDHDLDHTFYSCGMDRIICTLSSRYLFIKLEVGSLNLSAYWIKFFYSIIFKIEENYVLCLYAPCPSIVARLSLSIPKMG